VYVEDEAKVVELPLVKVIGAELVLTTEPEVWMTEPEVLTMGEPPLPTRLLDAVVTGEELV